MLRFLCLLKQLGCRLNGNLFMEFDSEMHRNIIECHRTVCVDNGERESLPEADGDQWKKLVKTENGKEFDERKIDNNRGHLLEENTDWMLSCSRCVRSIKRYSSFLSSFQVLFFFFFGKIHCANDDTRCAEERNRNREMKK